MIRVLLNAYACAPNKGSEPGLAWNWVINLAKYCRLYVITEGEWKSEIEAELTNLPQSENIKFYYNPVPCKVRKMCWNQGDWRFYYYYRKWQKQTLKIATCIIENNEIDIIHQFNMIGFREPGYLWKLEKPFLWGPIDAKEKFPVAYLKGADFRQKIFIHLKNKLTKYQFLNSSRIRSTIEKTHAIFGASSDSVKSIKKYYNKDIVLLNETGCYINTKIELKKKASKELDLLWVGKLDLRKQLRLALQTISYLNNQEVKLHIVGNEDNRETVKYKVLSERLGIESQCFWYGKVNHSRVHELMQESDLLFFTSVAEGTPHVVLESISNNLPVLCFDVCGQGDVVNEEVGIKIPLSNFNQSVKEFSDKIQHLFDNRNKLSKLSGGCDKRQKELSWENKVVKMISFYASCVSRD